MPRLDPENQSLTFNKLVQFFTSTHPKVIHNNHTDILFNGHLYYYNQGIKTYENKDSGKIEIHELNHMETKCEPLVSQSHKSRQILEAIQCCDKDKDASKKCQDGCCK